MPAAALALSGGSFSELCVPLTCGSWRSARRYRLSQNVDDDLRLMDEPFRFFRGQEAALPTFHHADETLQGHDRHVVVSRLLVRQELPGNKHARRECALQRSVKLKLTHGRQQPIQSRNALGVRLSPTITGSWSEDRNWSGAKIASWASRLNVVS